MFLVLYTCSLVPLILLFSLVLLVFDFLNDMGVVLSPAAPTVVPTPAGNDHMVHVYVCDMLWEDIRDWFCVRHHRLLLL